MFFWNLAVGSAKFTYNVAKDMFNNPNAGQIIDPVSASVYSFLPSNGGSGWIAGAY